MTFCVGLSNFILLPVMGALSDRVGRWPLLVTFTVLTLLTAYPVLSWLVGGAVVRPHAGHRAVAVVALRELQRRDGGRADRGDAGARAHRRVLAGLRLATAIFGGFTPLVSTWLIKVTGDHAAPG